MTRLVLMAVMMALRPSCVTCREYCNCNCRAYHPPGTASDGVSISVCRLLKGTQRLSCWVGHEGVLTCTTAMQEGQCGKVYTHATGSA